MRVICFLALILSLQLITVLSQSGLNADPNFFPITVWLQGEQNAPKFAQAGVDVYVDASPSHTITQAMLTTLKSNGIFVMGTINSVALNSPDTSQVIGWFSYDEPDDAQPLKNGSYGPCIDPSVVVSTYKNIKSQDPHNRPVFLNFGVGVADVNWVGRGSCTGKTNMYPEYAQGADIVSFDIYPRNEGYPLEIIATGVENLRKWTNYSKPVYCYIETTKISETSKARPSASDMKTEVWMALVHGAVGINYFCHQITPNVIEDECVANATIAQALKSIDSQIKSLAPVLNSPTVEGKVNVSSSNGNVPVDIIVKVYQQKTYIFAVAMRGTTVTATFTIKGVTNAVVTVIDEGRTRQVSNGVFSDSFEGYQVHLYSVNAV